MKVGNLTVQFEVPAFSTYEVPIGFLAKDRACHALFRYYLSARQMYEDHILDPIVYEGDVSQVVNFRQLFVSTATAYGVAPERMIQFWVNVDLQCDLLGIPRMPDEERYRFNRTPEIKTQ